MRTFLSFFGPGIAWAFLAAGLFASSASGAPVRPTDYLLGPGDLVSIKVFQNPDLSVDARVSETGYIAYPLLGEVKVMGLSAAETGAVITKRLIEGKFVVRPFVTVGISQYRSIQVSVLGQVAHPGKYPLEQSINRLTEVLALAGGETPTGADVVWLISAESKGSKRMDVDLPSLMRSGDMSKDPIVRNGDTIYVPREPVFYIYGEAQKPGQYRIEPNMDVSQALAVGGGPTNRGTDRGIQLSRRDASGRVTTRDAKPEELVQPNDVLFVRERLF